MTIIRSELHRQIEEVNAMGTKQSRVKGIDQDGGRVGKAIGRIQ
jgi:hypothetical protein